MDDRKTLAVAAAAGRSALARLLRTRMIIFATTMLGASAGCQSRVTGPSATPTRSPAPPKTTTMRRVTTPLPSLPRPAPRNQKVILGRSAQGAEIAMTVFGTSGPTLFVFGGIHGSEPTSAFIAEKLESRLRSDPSLYSGTRVAILSAANPDGLKYRRRENSRGVDLNRNFPARNWRAEAAHGSRPASEPETLALLRAMAYLTPHAVISIHAINGPRQCNNYDGPGELLARAMARGNGYPVKGTIGYPTPGSFGSWAGVDRGVPVITLELPQSLPAADAWRQNEAALLAAIRDTTRVARGASKQPAVQAGMRGR